jgi:hypothetical protein
MYSGHYSINDLQLDTIKDIDIRENRSKEILAHLVDRWNSKQYLSEHEKEFIFFSAGNKDFFKNDYCLDYNYFSYTYLIYAMDLHGTSKYYKWSNHKKTVNENYLIENLRNSNPSREVWRQTLIQAGIIIEIQKQEIDEALAYLREKASEWENNLKTNSEQFTDKLIKEFASETKTHLKELEKEKKENTIGYFQYLHKKKQILLFSKNAYFTSKKIIETFDVDKSYYILHLKDVDVRFYEYSMAHILMRHYSPATRDYNFINSKSFHIGDFPFNNIHTVLKTIFEQINLSNILPENFFSKNVVNLRFEFNNQNYFVGTKIDPNQNEKGKVPFRRIETFHIIEDQHMLKELNNEFLKKIIATNLYIYIKK